MNGIEKLQKLESLGIKVTSDMKERINVMCNLSEGIYRDGWKDGRKSNKAEIKELKVKLKDAQEESRQFREESRQFQEENRLLRERIFQLESINRLTN